MINIQNILQLGWDKNDPLPAFSESMHIARVVGEERGSYRLQFSLQWQAFGQITGKFRHQAKGRSDYPAVGDWILCEKQNASDKFLIHSILPRKTCLSRKVAGETSEEQIIATNMNYVFIATSCNQNFNIARIERYLALAWNSGAQPVVLLTKADLVSDKTMFEEAFKTLKQKVDYEFISKLDVASIQSLKKYFIPNKTNVIVGSSGVGKSTLINLLVGEEKLKTQDIRDDDGKGKHTTTARYLLPLPFGGLIIDTPGMREVQVLDATDGLEEQFSDVEELKLNCKFSDCKHQSEPSCAIKAAIKDGTLDEAHWQSYLKLQQEILDAKKKKEKREAHQSTKKWKKLNEEPFEKAKFKKR